VSDWNEVLDARRAGQVPGFHGTDQPLEELDADELPDVALGGLIAGVTAPDADGSEPRRPAPRTATARKPAARKTTAAKKAR
jgi:hypothetical protein